jgi:phosphatidylglycerol:prolipoprotein diacylglycerol transferase
MNPIAFNLFGLTIRWYGIMAALGFLAAVCVVQLKKKHANLKSDQISDLMLITIISGILGARTFYVIEFWSQFKNNLWEIIRVDHGGLVFYGGFICSMTVIIFYCRKKKLSVISVMDIVAPGVALGHALGRIGCFLNGCCYGKPGSNFMCVAYPAGSHPAEKYPGIPLHPVQLYETFGNLIIFGIVFYFAGRLKKGMNLSLYIILYGILRFSDEFYRGDHTDFFLGIFTPAQTIGLVLIPAGIALFIFFWKRKDDPKQENNS